MSWKKSRRNNASRKRRNNVSMRKRRNNVSMRKRRNNMTMRRMMYGGYDSSPASVNGNSMATMQAQSLAQGQQFDALHKNQHGGAVALAPATLPPMPVPGPGAGTNLEFRGNLNINPVQPAGPAVPMVAPRMQLPPGMPPPPGMLPPANAPPMVRQRGGGLDAGPFPGAVVSPSVLPENLHASARVAPLDAAIKEIQGLKDQSGGRRRRGGKKSKKSRKGRKGRKGSRRQRGGAWNMDNAQSVNAPGLILPPGLEAKALSGMNAEWKLAENPKAFAPGYASY